jgi:hypothetical protein
MMEALEQETSEWRNENQRRFGLSVFFCRLSVFLAE